MSNIRFVYLYRDGANYKSWGEVVFNNQKEIDLSELENRLVAAFLPDKLFIANQIRVPEKFLFENSSFTKNDHCFHEFDCVETCRDNPTDILRRSITDFLQDVETASLQGWKAFNILERA
jgi:hypothetical protein